MIDWTQATADGMCKECGAPWMQETCKERRSSDLRYRRHLIQTGKLVPVNQLERRFDRPVFKVK